MKKNVSIGVSLLFAAMALTGCSSEDNPWAVTPGEGGIKLNFGVDASVKDALPTRAVDGSTLFTVPSTEAFSIRLEKADGSYSHIWPTLADFMKEESFPTGTYTLTAFYGDIKETGIEKPHFSGMSEVTVLAARQTEVSVNASLANSLISVEYTQGFKDYLSDYSALIHTVGGDYVPIDGDESRPVFIEPGEIELGFTFTNPQGKQATIYPDEAKFTALARHYYHVTLDVNAGQNGVAQLAVIFDDTLSEETVTIDLTDELFTAAAPVVKADGWADTDTYEFLTGKGFDSRKRFNIFARGGLKDVVFTVSSEGYTPAYGNEVHLIDATAEQQQQLAAAGIDVKGLFRVPENLAFVDVTDMAAKLPAGAYTLSILAKDRLDRASEPVSLSFTVVEPHVAVAAEGAALFGTNECRVKVTYNGSDTKDITFKAMNMHGTYIDCETLGVTEQAGTRAVVDKTYIYRLHLPDTGRSSIPMKVFLNGKEFADLTFNIPVITPDYSVEADAYAHKVVIKVSASEAQRAVVVNNLHVFNSGSLMADSQISRDADNGFITVKGLTPSQQYTFKFTLTNSLSDSDPSTTFTTEAAAGVPNGDFEQTHQTINITGINNGGEYKAGVKDRCFNTSDITVSEPTGWTSLNSLTCYEGSNPKNTWFMVPSTFSENGAVKIRSVAYSHSGTLPDYKNYGLLNYTYYSQNAPASISDRASGELFLGSYSYNGSISRVDGVDFASRPASLTFDYMYQPYGSEVGLVEIAVINASGAVIARADADLTSAGSMTPKTIALPAYGFKQKAAKLSILFKSTKGSVSTIIPSGDSLDDTGDATNKVGVTPPAGSGYHIAANKYKALSTGSVLTIDNVKLNYDGANGAQGKNRRVAIKRVVRKAARR